MPMPGGGGAAPLWGELRTYSCTVRNSKFFPKSKACLPLQQMASIDDDSRAEPAASSSGESSLDRPSLPPPPSPLPRPQFAAQDAAEAAAPAPRPALHYAPKQPASSPGSGPGPRSEGADAPAAGSANSLWHACVTLLGLSPSRTCWGTRPFDLGCRWAKREVWYKDIDSHDGHHDHSPTWFNTPWYHVPRVRHLWGDAQYELHAGGKELFLDLIFVGVAYQVGGVLKAAFYSCDAGSSSSSSSGATAGGRQLAPSSPQQDACLGLGVGIVHSCAPFLCMYLLWGLETRFRAQFLVSSKVHYAVDALTTLLLIFAGMNIMPIATYYARRDLAGLDRVLTPILIVLGVWIVRLLEISLFAER